MTPGVIPLLMVQELSEGELPDIEFKPGSGLSELVLNLTRRQQVVTEISSDKVLDVMTQFETDLSSGSNGGDPMLFQVAPPQETYRKFLEVLTKGYGAAVDTINELHTQIGQLTEQIVSSRDQILAANPVTRNMVMTNLEYFDNQNLPEMDWSGITYLGTELSIVNVVSDRFGISTTADQRNLIRVVEVFQLKADQGAKSALDINLGDDERVEDLISTIRRNASSLLPSTIKESLRILTSQFALRSFLDEVKTMVNKEVGVAETVVQLLTKIRNIAPVMMVLQKYALNLDTAMKDAVAVNCNLVELALQSAAFFVIVKRKEYRDKIVLSNRMLNPDMKEELQAKGDRAMILKYLYVKFDQFKLGLPEIGLTLDDILAANESCTAKVEELIEANSLAFKLVKDDASRSAMCAALAGVEESESGTAVTPNQRLMIKHCADVMITMDISIEDALYKYFIMTRHEGTLVETVFRTLGVSYLKALKLNPTVTSETARMIKMKVIIELVIDHLMCRYIQPATLETP